MEQNLAASAAAAAATAGGQWAAFILPGMALLWSGRLHISEFPDGGRMEVVCVVGGNFLSSRP